jgi:hypothetical protein
MRQIGFPFRVFRGKIVTNLTAKTSIAAMKNYQAAKEESRKDASEASRTRDLAADQTNARSLNGWGSVRAILGTRFFAVALRGYVVPMTVAPIASHT